MELATGSALADIAVSDESDWYIADLDIANAFYSLELPPELRRYFCLPGLGAGELGITYRQGGARCQFHHFVSSVGCCSHGLDSCSSYLSENP